MEDLAVLSDIKLEVTANIPFSLLCSKLGRLGRGTDSKRLGLEEGIPRAFMSWTRTAYALLSHMSNSISFPFLSFPQDPQREAGQKGPGRCTGSSGFNWPIIGILPLTLSCLGYYIHIRTN